MTETVKTTRKTARRVGRSRAIAAEDVFIRPHITEKSTDESEKNEDGNVYSFVIDGRATKNEVKKAAKEIFNVDPIKVNIVNHKAKEKKNNKGKKGKSGGFKKAVVTLKEGQKIEFV